MKIALLSVACGLLVVGCSKEQPANPPQTPAAPSAPASTAPASTAPAPAEKPVAAATQAPATPAPAPAPAPATPAAPAPSSAPAASVPLPSANSAVSTQPAVAAASNAVATTAAALTGTNAVQALQQLFTPAIQSAVTQLSQPGGFLNNTNVKIGMPQQLQGVEKVVRGLGQGQIADQVISSINVTAEKSAPAVGSVLSNTLAQVKPEDIQKLSTNSAASTNLLVELLRQKAGTQITGAVQPYVKSALDKTGAGSACQQLLDKANLNPFSSASSTGPVQIDQLITSKTVDGMFKVISDKEQQLRQNPQNAALLNSLLSSGTK